MRSSKFEHYNHRLIFLFSLFANKMLVGSTAVIVVPHPRETVEFNAVFIAVIVVGLASVPASGVAKRSAITPHKGTFGCLIVKTNPYLQR